MNYYCVGLGCYALGLFTALFLYAWLDEREDGFANIKIIPRVHLDSNYPSRVHGVIRTVCPYCRRLTISHWCEGHHIYFCVSHNWRSHKDC